MKKNVIQYSIVQFLPYPNREEAVNIGIVSFCPKLQDFRFQLLSANKKKRANDFFKTLPKTLFKQTISLVSDELNRLQFMQNHQAVTEAVFLELIRPRESLIRYSEARVLMVEDYQESLNKLFDELVAFESKVYTKNHEHLLAQKFKGILKQHNIDELFKEEHLKKENIGLSVVMPFFNKESHKSVKPLSFLDQKDENSLIMHAGHWANKIELLIQAGLLEPENHLVTYEMPKKDYEAAFEFALERLDKTNVNLAEINENHKINPFIQLH